MDEASPVPPRGRRPLRPILVGLATLGVLAVGSVLVLAPRDGGRLRHDPSDPSIRTSGPSIAATSTSNSAGQPAVSLPGLDTDERAVADAYLGLATAFDEASADIQISDPLAEFDLVGARLIDLLDRTSAQVAALPPPGRAFASVRDLGTEMTATIAMLRAIDPHGSRDLAATQYRQALDYWIDHVKPVTDSLRRTLGLPATPGGDLRL